MIELICIKTVVIKDSDVVAFRERKNGLPLCVINEQGGLHILMDDQWFHKHFKLTEEQ
jgi:hypothetical protein